MPILSTRKSPKFAMELTIKELTNIPKLSGSAYVNWKIKATSAHGSTNKSHIHRYKSSWNYSVVETVRISIGSKSQLHDKDIKFKVYTQNHVHNATPLHGLKPTLIKHTVSESSINFNKAPGPSHTVDSEATCIGTLKINLSEFANYPEGPVSRRYLLEESKINCILSMEISLRLVSGDPKSFIPPPVKHRGISSMLGSSEQQSSIPGEGSSGIDSNNHDQSIGVSASSYYYKKLSIHSDPVLLKLYQKSFQISWDERPGEFTPHECIDDIFHGGDGWAKNEEGDRLIDLNRLQSEPSERERYININRRISLERCNSNHSSSGSQCNVNLGRDKAFGGVGGVSELQIRGDLKSWNVSHIRD
ncbi:hypothetical protein WICPIJ_006007 [Wickerhamomyces pijperi]|uniref:C2 NT-type domain-containing protein n=1 Tax=Wickerhamomyces pijperi TaxID=599730 RepID=A0A9P8Q2H2_WICPI|nr:hypothetical protein WICPIJ_006007 [Wickerhamomyces pijperi]